VVVSPLSELTPGEFPCVLALTTLAIYLCVPETDQMPTVALMVVMLAGIEIVTRQPSAPAVQLVAAGIVLWAGLYGATGRSSAIVGTLFAFWPFVLVGGVTLGLRWRERPPARRPQRWAIEVTGGIAAIAVARTGALEPTVRPALVAVGIAAGVSIVVCGLLLRPVDRVRDRVTV
jgi:hypothetical protein